MIISLFLTFSASPTYKYNDEPLVDFETFDEVTDNACRNAGGSIITKGTPADSGYKTTCSGVKVSGEVSGKFANSTSSTCAYYSMEPGDR